MRRPICIIGLAFVIVLFLFSYWKPYAKSEGVPEPFSESDAFLALKSSSESDAILVPETSSVSESISAIEDKSTVTITGQVDQKEYRISYNQKVLVLYLKKVQFQSNLLNSTKKQENIGLICYMKKQEGDIGKEPKIGSFVCMRGTFREFLAASNPGAFDAKKYYQILNLHGRIQNGVILEESVEYDKFREVLYQIKQYAAALLDYCFAKKEASIMKAMLLGEKQLLDEEVKELYQINGIIHILSISGLHISMIGMSFYKILCKLKIPLWIRTFLAIGVMYCYGVMVGMGVSSIRAILMFGIHLCSKLCKRTYDMLTAMTIAAIGILIEQPLYLQHSGFLFSFGAIIGIGLLAPTIKENFPCGIMSTNLAVSIFTFPVYLNFYYEYPLYSTFLNFFIIPCTSIVVADGLACIAGAAILPSLGRLLTIPSNIILWCYEAVCSFFAILPGNRQIMGQPCMIQILIFVFLICFTSICCKNMTKLQYRMCLLLAFFCITIRFSDGLQVTFLDVGQGDGIYLEDGVGGHYLIDGGSSSQREVGKYCLLPFLKAEGVDKLDIVFVTHLDNDHYNGIWELMEQTGQSGVKIETLALPDLAGNMQDEKFIELLALAKEQEIEVVYLSGGAVIQHGKMRMTCLYPQASDSASAISASTVSASEISASEISASEISASEISMNTISAKEVSSNENSLVLYLEYEDFSALFTGDLEGQGEQEVIDELEERKLFPITVLKVAHHGSKNSTSAEMLAMLRPIYAVISCGRDNSYGHPHKELLQRLKQAGTFIYQTTESGAVTMRVKNNQLRCEEYRK